MAHPRALAPHVLVFPLPLQGPVKAMFKLTKLLCLAGIQVTFLVTDHIRGRLLRHTDIQSHFARYAGFRLAAISSGLADDHPRLADQFTELMVAWEAVTKPLYREKLASVSKEIGLPVICSTTISPCFLWVIFCLHELIEAGEAPIGEKDLDGLITGVPGMEGVLRRRDLPSFCRSSDPGDPYIQLYLAERELTPQADGLILNSFEDLEGPLLAHQPEKSVIYVSFGSLATVTKDQLMEFWHGLVNADHRAREDGQGQIPPKLREGTEARGCILAWAPQEEVLAHRAVAAFLTHGGWNSTLESVYRGVAMICWPYFVDQQVDSRFVGEVGKLRLDMKDTCDPVVIERKVKELMEVRRPGGSSWCDLDRLIKD
ncbi:7-deoxyloganetic acid glucosyltransferase [Bertholletia excelsa]